ncbi:I17RC protein, partial [Glaucidium brasilianum]|nr:I17RC protein [Glaucidium brasilianum]
HPCPGATTDVEAWERLWARSRLVLHGVGSQALTCSLSAPCDLPAQLVPCWQPVPTGPCQALPGLQQPAVGPVSGAPWGAEGTAGRMQAVLTEHPFCPQGHQDFGGLRPHPNLCVQVGHPSAPRLPHGQPQGLLTHSLGQVWSGGQVRLIQCLRDREYCWGVLPGRPDDVLLLEYGGNASLCALERGACTPLASFTSTVRDRDPRVPVAVAPVAQPAQPLLPLQGAGHPGLLEQELRRDVAAGQCRQVSVGSWGAADKDRAVSDISPCPQIWHPENSTGVMLWACPLHKYLRARWALVWMGVLLGAACLLLLVLLKKEDVKGERCPSGGCARPAT